MHGKAQVVSRIYNIIENIELELDEVKELVYQVTNDEIDQDEIFVDAELAEEEEEERKPAAKPKTTAKERNLEKKRQIAEARWRSQVWVEEEAKRIAKVRAAKAETEDSTKKARPKSSDTKKPSPKKPRR